MFSGEGRTKKIRRFQEHDDWRCTQVPATTKAIKNALDIPIMYLEFCYFYAKKGRKHGSTCVREMTSSKLDSKRDRMRGMEIRKEGGGPPGHDHNLHGVRLTKQSIFIHKKPRILRVGSLQWFRVPEHDWEDLLARFKASGLNTVDMYVAWRDVEPVREGEFDAAVLSAMCRFLELTWKYDLFVYFRPGPYICDEFDGGGIPAWLLKFSTERDDDKDDSKVIMRTSCRNWLRHVKRYFDKINSLIRPYLATRGGPIIIYAVENEYRQYTEIE
eukprot:jgi/Bigna1/126960/aug1.3_g1668